MRFSFIKFDILLLKISFVIVLLCTSALADGIVLKNGMQLVVTIRDTTGDSINVQEGLYAGRIPKSNIASFWYKNTLYSYDKSTRSKHATISQVSSPAIKIEAAASHVEQDSSAINGISVYNKKIASSEDSSIQENTIETQPHSEIISQTTNTSQHDSLTDETQPVKDATGTAKQIVQSNLSEQDTDIEVEESDESAPVQLYDPEYTNEKLARKKKFFLTFFGASCAMGVTSAAVIGLSNSIDAIAGAAPFVIASIPLTIVSGIKSREYIKRYKAAEYKKRRAQLSLSLQPNRTDLIFTF